MSINGGDKGGMEEIEYMGKKRMGVGVGNG